MRPSITNRSLGPLRARKKQLQWQNKVRAAERQDEAERLKRGLFELYSIVHQIDASVPESAWMEALPQGVDLQEHLRSLPVIHDVYKVGFPENVYQFLLDNPTLYLEAAHYFKDSYFHRYVGESGWWEGRTNNVLKKCDPKHDAYGVEYNKVRYFLDLEARPVSQEQADVLRNHQKEKKQAEYDCAMISLNGQPEEKVMWKGKEVWVFKDEIAYWRDSGRMMDAYTLGDFRARNNGRDGIFLILAVVASVFFGHWFFSLLKH